MSENAEKPKAAPAIDATNANQVANYITAKLEKERVAAETPHPLKRPITAEKNVTAEDMPEPGQGEDETEEHPGQESSDESEEQSQSESEEESKDEEGNEEGEEDDGEDESTYLVKVDGEEIEVGLSELIKGYSRQSDYTRKTSALAEARKEFEVKRGEFVEEVNRSYRNLLDFDPFLSHAKNIQWDKLARENPEQFTRLKDEHERRLMRIQEIRAQHAERSKHGREAAQAEAERQFVKAHPEYRDEAKLDSFREEIAQFLGELQYSPDDISSMLDHRFFLLAKEALEGRNLRKAMNKMKDKKVPLKAARVQRPGSGGNEQRGQSKAIKALKEKAKASGRMSDLMRLVDAIN